MTQISSLPGNHSNCSQMRRRSCWLPANTTSLYNKDAHANGDFQTLAGETSPPPLACSEFDGVNDGRETYAFQIGAGFAEATRFHGLPKGGGGAPQRFVVPVGLVIDF